MTTKCSLAMLAALLMLAGCRPDSQQLNAVPQMRLEGARVLIVVPPKDFRRNVYDAVVNALEAEGATCDVCAPEADQAVGTQGRRLQMTADTEADPDQYDALVFISGPGMKAFAEHPDLMDLATDFASERKLVAAMRLSINVLANADLIRDKSVAAPTSMRSSVEARGAQFSTAPVEVDGNIITARGPEATGQYARAIVEALVTQRSTR